MIKSIFDESESEENLMRQIADEEIKGDEAGNFAETSNFPPAIFSDSAQIVENDTPTAKEQNEILEIPPFGKAESAFQTEPVKTFTETPMSEINVPGKAEPLPEILPPSLLQEDYKPETAAETIRKSGLAYGAALTLFGAVVFMLILGWFFDLIFGSSPWGIVVGIVVGAIIGFYQFFKITSHIINNKK